MATVIRFFMSGGEVGEGAQRDFRIIFCRTSVQIFERTVDFISIFFFRFSFFASFFVLIYRGLFFLLSSFLFQPCSSRSAYISSRVSSIFCSFRSHFDLRLRKTGTTAWKMVSGWRKVARRRVFDNSCQVFGSGRVRKSVLEGDNKKNQAHR